GSAAGSKSNPGSLREAQDERSRPLEDERRADESLSRAGREPRERMRADAPDAARALRVLRDAVGCDRAAWRAVHRLDPRSLRTRSAFHHPRAHGCDDDDSAEDDAIDG